MWRHLFCGAPQSITCKGNPAQEEGGLPLAGNHFGVCWQPKGSWMGEVNQGGCNCIFTIENSPTTSAVWIGALSVAAAKSSGLDTAPPVQEIQATEGPPPEIWSDAAEQSENKDKIMN